MSATRWRRLADLTAEERATLRAEIVAMRAAQNDHPQRQIAEGTWIDWAERMKRSGLRFRRDTSDHSRYYLVFNGVMVGWVIRQDWRPGNKWRGCVASVPPLLKGRLGSLSETRTIAAWHTLGDIAFDGWWGS